MRSARGWVAAGALLLNVLAVGLAHAGPWDACFHATKVDETIKACTREIVRQLASGRAGNHDLAVAFFIRGKAMLKVDFDRAMMDFDKSTQIDPGIADVYDTRGVQFQYHKHDLARAITDFSRAVQLAPTNVQFLLHRASALKDKKDYDAAIADFDQVIKLDPAANAFIGRGSVLDRKMEYERAIADFNEAIRIAAGNSTAYFDRAVVYLRKGDFDQAIKDGTTAIELNSRRHSQRSGLSAVSRPRYFMSADYAAATTDFEAVVKDHPDHVSAVLWLYLARARSHDPSAAAALADSSRKIENSPKPDPIYETAFGYASWLQPVARLLLGEQTPEATLAGAANPDQGCQLQFFIGEWGVLHEDAAVAGRHFKAAIASDCPADAFEYYAARAELDRLPK